MSEYYLNCACNDGFPYEWAEHHLPIYLANESKPTAMKFVAYLHTIEAKRTTEQRAAA